MALETQLKKVYDKQLQEKNNLIFKYQEQLSIHSKNQLANVDPTADCVPRSKSLSTVQKQQQQPINLPKQIYYLPVSNKSYDSIEEDQCGRIKQNSYNNSLHQSMNQQNVSRSMQYSQQKKVPSLSMEKENQERSPYVGERSSKRGGD